LGAEAASDFVRCFGSKRYIDRGAPIAIGRRSRGRA